MSMIRSFVTLATLFMMTDDPGCFSFGGSSSPAPTAAPSSSAPPGHLSCMKPPIVEAVCTPPSAGSPCTGLPGTFMPGCIGGCMMQTCPGQLACAQLPADLPCGMGCVDLGGATFWSKLIDTTEGCTQLTNGTQPELGKCTIQVMEQTCPALVGSGWTSKLPGLMK